MYKKQITGKEKEKGTARATVDEENSNDEIKIQ